MELDLDTVPELFGNESDHMPTLLSFRLRSSDFLLSIRCEAISFISQAQFSSNLDPFMCYLAINYMDRFICKQDMPEGKVWIGRLLGLSCLSLAGKMKHVNLSMLSLQTEQGFIFDTQSISRMELLILSALNWRMHSTTPHAFLCYFISLSQLRDPSLLQALKHQASDIIFQAHLEMSVLEYKPSLIAASALLCSTTQLCPSQFHHLKSAISSCQYVNHEELWKCLDVVQGIVIKWYEPMIDAAPTSTVMQSGVLDLQCTNSEKQEITTNESLTHGRDNIKRRKLSKLRSSKPYLSAFSDSSMLI